MALLVDNHLAIPFLKKILPELRDYIHDSSEKVRIAMFDLLLKVKGIRPIKFWKVVPIEHILVRLETDSAPIKRRIMQLVSDSFGPLGKEPSQQVEWCINLINLNRRAARQFFLNIPKSLGSCDTAKYIIVLCRYALESSRLLARSRESRLQTEDRNRDSEDSDESLVVKKARKKVSGKTKDTVGNVMADESDENDDSTDTVDGLVEPNINSLENVTERSASDDSEQMGSSMDDVNILTAVMEAVYLMFTVILPELSASEHKVLKEGLCKKLSITIKELLSMWQNKDLEAALFGLAGYLPHRVFPLLSQKLLNRIKMQTLPADQLSLVVKTLIQWGRADDLLEIVGESLEAEFHQEDVDKSKMKDKKKAKKGGVTFTAETTVFGFDKAIDTLISMLSLAESRLILKENHRCGLRTFADKLNCILDFMKSLLSPDELNDGSSFDEPKRNSALQAFSIYLRTSAFLIAPNSKGERPDQENNWICMKRATDLSLDVALPCLLSNKNPTADDQKFKMASQVAELVMKTSNDLLIVGVFTTDFLDQILELCRSILKAHDLPMSLTQGALSLVYQVTQLRTKTETVVAMETDAIGDDVGGEGQPTTGASKNGDIVVTCLTEALNSLSFCEKKIDKTSGSLTNYCSILSDIVQSLTSPRTNSEVRDRILAMVSASLIQHLKTCSEKETLISNDGDSLPIFVLTLISTMMRKATCRE